jgi:hypothetical protein
MILINRLLNFKIVTTIYLCNKYHHYCDGGDDFVAIL